MLLLTGLRQHPASEVDYVIDELNRRGIPFFRFNLDDYPTHTDLSMCLGSSSTVIGQVAQRSKCVSLEAITAAWFYSPVPVEPDSQMAPESRGMAVREAVAALNGLWQAAGVRWVNPPLNAGRAANRVWQMHLTRVLGFHIPDTLITNDVGAAKNFLQSYQDVIIKDLATPYLVTDSHVFTSFTRHIRNITPDQLEAVALAPCLFQECIPKKHEVRAYVIGDQVLAAGIAPLDEQDVGEDYRRRRYQVRVWPYVLPSKDARRCLALTKDLGLQYAGIDLIVTPQGDVVFLELGPYSSWVWAEELGGLPLTKALTDLLEQLAH
jgi:hypothetical protein